MTFIKKIKTKSGAYAIEVKGYRDEDGKVKHKYMRYLGKLDEKGNVIPSMRIENTDVENVKLHGPVQVLHRMAGDMGLEFILGDYSPEILTLVYSHILRPESLNNIKRAINWIDTDELGLELPVSRKRLEHAMDSLEKRVQHIESNIYERICEQCDCSTLLYDVTGVYFYGKEVKRAKRGHGSHLPQIGIGLAVESQYGIPLFHMLFDAKTFPVILGRLKEFKRETCTLVYDRGIASKKNVADAVANGFSVIACIPCEGTA